MTRPLFNVSLDSELRRHLANAVRAYEVTRRQNGLYGLPPVLGEFNRAVLTDYATEGHSATDTGGLPVDHEDAIYVSTELAARLLGVSKRTVARRIQDGSLPSVLLGGRRLISRETLKGL